MEGAWPELACPFRQRVKMPGDCPLFVVDGECSEGGGGVTCPPPQFLD